MKILYTYILTLIILTNQSFSQWVPLNQPLNKEITSIYKENATIYIGTKNGGVYSSPEPFMNFTQKNNGLNENRIHCINKIKDKLAVGSYGGGVYFSSDEGNFWVQSKNGMQIPYIFTIQESGNNILAGADKYVYLSDDNGNSWKESLVINYIINQIYKFENELLVAGGPLLYSSTDEGMTWNLVVNASNTTIKCVAKINHQNSNYLFVGTLDGVYLSTDNGKQWTTKNSGLDYKNVNVLVAKNDYLFAATENGGVYMTSDFGNNWSAISSGFPQNTSVRAIIIDNNDMYAATAEGTVWKINLSEVISEVENNEFHEGNFNIFPNPAIDEIVLNRTDDSFEVFAIVDIYGNVIRKLNLKMQSEKIDLTNLSLGIYFVKNLTTGRIIKIIKY